MQSPVMNRGEPETRPELVLFALPVETYVIGMSGAASASSSGSTSPS
jgi:hypothetical protein